VNDPSSGARLLTAGDGRLQVQGAMDFATVGRLLAEAEPLFRRNCRLLIDLSGVKTANSAGLVLLLEWMDLARSRRVSLRYLNLPESLARIADISNIRSLLPVVENGSVPSRVS
jgi:phospholipid transport system transporter-binding protein